MASAAPPSAISKPGTFPRYREALRYCWSKDCEGLPPRHIFYDVKFYPYSASADSSAPVFALVGNREVVVCRTALAKGESVSCIRVLHDTEAAPEDWSTTSSSILNSCAWNYIDQSAPLLSVAGTSGLIKVLSVTTGEVVSTLVGHGGEVNDLATHPLYPWILASASGDHSIRIWDLRRATSNSGEGACLIICGHGQGHKEPVLSCAWHGLGRYLISGGQDHLICIWTIPDLNPQGTFFNKDDWKASSSKSLSETKVIHFPHFATSAVHSNYVDCVCFYGDLILSKAVEEDKIVLWMATGFNGRAPPPPNDSAPATDVPQDTRSGFVSKAAGDSEPGKGEASKGPRAPQIPLFSRLLQFSLASTELFYMRFSLLLPSRGYPHLHPMLVIGNTKSKIFFWDLGALELGHNGATLTTDNDSAFSSHAGSNDSRDLSSTRHSAKETSILNARSRSFRASSSHSSSSALMPNIVSSPSTYHPPGSEASTAAPASITRETPVRVPTRSGQYNISDPLRLLRAHYSHTPNVNYYFLARQAAWSPCGRWCVIAGESGSKDAMAVIYDRWT